MAETMGHISEEEIHERKTAQMLFSGSMAEGLVSGVAAVLAIIGLIGGFPLLLLSVATITLGAALLFEGAAISAKFYDLIAETSTSKVTAAELSSGTTAESLAGITGIALGILSLVGIVPLVLIPSAAIAIGGCIIMGAGANARIYAFGTWKREQHLVKRLNRPYEQPPVFRYWSASAELHWEFLR